MATRKKKIYIYIIEMERESYRKKYIEKQRII